MPTKRTPTKPQWNPPEIAELKAIPGIEVQRLIGHGGMGAVYLARQVREDRLVALKVARTRQGSAHNYKALIVHEAQVMAQLDHKNIVKVYDFGIQDSLVWVAMEFVAGCTLRELLQARRMSAWLSLSLSKQLCAGLQHAHTRGVIHHDLKPENILVDGENRAKIADFGISKVRDFSYTIARPGIVTGTVRYMAPEQRRYPLHFDHRSDIYCLGIMMYEMLTGRIPRGAYLPPSHFGVCEGALDRIVLKCLNSNPNNRWQSAAELLAAMSRVVVEEPEPPSVQVSTEIISDAPSGFTDRSATTSVMDQ
jgi:serine/threonine protein kinase